MAEKLFGQIMDVRDSGEVNMLDANGVQYVAFHMGHYELVAFIEDHRGKYAKFIMSGDESLLEE